MLIMPLARMRSAINAKLRSASAEMDFKKLYDEEKQENERLRMKLGRVERELAELSASTKKG